MAPLTIEGSNLGERHRSFNTLVKEAIAKQQNVDLTLTQDDYLQNLIKIEVAAANRNVDFILQVLKGEDMMYVSRALKCSTWFITDNQYAHIVNPEYLYTDLRPQMTVGAFNKLLLNIRLNLKDEKRVELFYNYINVRNPKEASKWLQFCSIPFIQEVVRKHKDEINEFVLKRIFKKSFKIYETFCSLVPYSYKLTNDKRSISMYALQNTEQLLNLLDESKVIYCYNFGPKITKHFMSTYPERILNKIDSYHHCIDLTTFVKCIKGRKNLIDILVSHAKKKDGYNFFSRENLNYWKYLLPEANRFNLIKKYFIDGEEVDKEEIVYFHLCETGIKYPENIYTMYKHAPFKVAFEEIKKLIRTISDPETRNSMLEVILSAAGKDLINIRVFLQYYLEKHVNEAFKFKKDFINKFLEKTVPHTFDNETWDILNRIFHSLEVYINSENNVRNCVETIIVRSVIHGVDIPDIIQSKFKFNTMISYQKKLKDLKQKDAVFDYLYRYLNKDIEDAQITKENDIFKLMERLTLLLELLKVWNKDIINFPTILDKIKQLIKIKKENNYKVDLSSLYNKNKTWKRFLFEESIALAPSDQVCVNIIKHDIDLFKRNKNEIFYNDKVILKRVLMKIKVYWPDTVSKEIKTLYAERINNATSFEALVTGICLLYTQNELKTFIETYAPTKEKIDWNESDEKVFNLRKHIAMKMYKMRPLIPVDFIIMYAKGDYLQYTIPSLCAMSEQKSLANGKQLVTKLLDAPVSLQKFGIRYAVRKLDTEDLVPICTDIWNSTKSSTIRMVLLTSMQTRLCQEQDVIKIRLIWEAISKCINDLTLNENKTLYKKISDLQNIPLSIKPEYFMKVYKILSLLSTKNKDRFRSLLDDMKSVLRDTNSTLMKLLDDDFAVNFLMKDFLAEIEKDDYSYNGKHIFVSFLLHVQDEDAQIRRYEKFLAPLLDTFINSWSKEGVHGDTKLKQLIQSMLTDLNIMFTEYILKNKENIVVPYKLFRKIYLQLENGLKYERNYVLITYWKLTTEFVKLINENKDIFLNQENIEDQLRELHKKIAADFGKFCAEIFKEDLQRFYPSIYILYIKTLKEFFFDFYRTFYCDPVILLNYYKYILEYGKSEEIFIAMTSLIKHTVEHIYEKERWIQTKDIREVLYKHPSKALKLHYYDLFRVDYES